MAKQTTVHLVDDLDGSEAEYEDFELAVGGKRVLIDLSETHFQELMGAVDKFVQAGRPAGRPTVASPQRRQRSAVGAARQAESREEKARIREWARANGHEVSDRGRLSQAVLAAYAAAH